MALRLNFFNEKRFGANFVLFASAFLFASSSGIADTQLNGFSNCNKADDGRPVCRDDSSGKLKFVTEQFYAQYLSISSASSAREQFRANGFSGMFGTLANEQEVCSVFQHPYFKNDPEDIKNYRSQNFPPIQRTVSWIEAQYFRMAKSNSARHGFELDASTREKSIRNLSICWAKMKAQNPRLYAEFNSSFSSRDSVLAAFTLKEASAPLYDELTRENEVISSKLQQSLAAKTSEKAYLDALVSKEREQNRLANEKNEREKGTKQLTELYRYYQCLDVCGRPKSYSARGFEVLKKSIKIAEDESGLTEAQRLDIWNRVDQDFKGVKMMGTCPAIVQFTDVYFMGLNLYSETVDSLNKPQLKKPNF